MYIISTEVYIMDPVQVLIHLMVNVMMLVFNMYATFYIVILKLYIHIYICYIQLIFLQHSYYIADFIGGWLWPWHGLGPHITGIVSI